MTKQQLLDQVVDDTGQTRTEVERLYEAIFERMSKALEAGERFEVRGFGIFEVKETKARTGRNPATGQIMEIPARRKATFRPSKELKQRLASMREMTSAKQNA